MGLPVISSWSLAQAPLLPAKALDPITMLKTLGNASAKAGCWPKLSSSATATSAAAPPPTPLKRATICGMAVIFTMRAPMLPTAPPMTTPMAMMITPAVVKWSSDRVATSAITMPTAAMRFPLRAPFGELSCFKPRMKHTAAVGMVIALVATLPLLHFTTAGVIIIAIGVAIGATAGSIGARMVKMTAIPQMVALFNGVGGGAAALVAVAELLSFGQHPAFAAAFPSVFSIVIGSISFAGSMVAFAKLQELMTGTPITYPGQQIVNGILAAAILGFVIAVLAIASIPFSFISPVSYT